MQAVRLRQASSPLGLNLDPDCRQAGSTLTLTAVRLARPQPQPQSSAKPPRPSRLRGKKFKISNLTSKILLAHPGTQYSYALAAQLHRLGLLYKFATCLAFGDDEPQWVRWLPASWQKQRKRRTVTGVPLAQLWRKPWLEMEALIRIRKGKAAQQVFFHRNEKFQRQLPDKVLLQADLVIGFDTSSWILQERCKKLGKPFILDASIAHPLSQQQVFQQLAERFPLWAGQLPAKDPKLIAIEQQEMQQADHIVVASAFTRQTYMDHGVDSQKISINHYGTDLSAFTPRQAPSTSVTEGEPATFLHQGYGRQGDNLPPPGLRQASQQGSSTRIYEGEPATGNQQPATDNQQRSVTLSSACSELAEELKGDNEQRSVTLSSARSELAEESKGGNQQPATNYVEGQPPVFLFFGAITARKGFPWLCEVWESFHRQYPQAKLIAAGYGDLPEGFRLPGGIELTGFVHPRDRLALFHRADVFVFPSFFEGFAQVIIEAMACGLPVVTTNHTVGAELIQAGQQGCCMSPGEDEALLQSLCFFAEHPNQVAAMGHAARQAVEGLTWDAYGDRWAGIIKGVLGS